MATNIGNIPTGYKVATGIIVENSMPITISCGFKPTKIMFFICPNPDDQSTTRLYQYSYGNLLITGYYDGSSFTGIWVYRTFVDTNGNYYFGVHRVDLSISFNSTGCTISSSSLSPSTSGTPYQWIAWT